MVKQNHGQYKVMYTINDWKKPFTLYNPGFQWYLNMRLRTMCGKPGVNVSLLCVLSINYLLWDGTRQRVEEQDEEHGQDEQNQCNDDVLLIVLPDQVEETLEGIDKPREGRVGTARRKVDHLSPTAVKVLSVING